MKKRMKPANSDHRRDKSTANQGPLHPGELPFPIVGIGASTGGREAMEQFLRNVPPGCGLAQEPASAKFDSMPRSAIDAGLADLVAPAEELPGKIRVSAPRPRHRQERRHPGGDEILPGRTQIEQRGAAELTTSREEMQSLNEELQTVNAEQQSKTDELARLNNDMRNLLNSTEIVTVFLDNDLHIRRFTSGANQLFKLIPGDVGRPLSNIASDLLYPEMIEEAREVLRTLFFSEEQIAATDGRWFSVRMMPYRTLEDVIGGVVITFTDITATRALEAQLREENARLKGLLEAGQGGNSRH